MLTLIAILVAVSGSFAQSIDELKGFRDIPFGSPSEQVKGLAGTKRAQVLVEREGVDTYQVPGTSLASSELFGLEIAYVEFTYWRDSLARVAITLKERVYSEEAAETELHNAALDFVQPVLAGLSQRYGKSSKLETTPDNPRAGPLLFINADWRGSTAKASISLQVMRDLDNKIKHYMDPAVKVRPTRIVMSVSLASTAILERWKTEEAEASAARARMRKDGV